MGYLKEENKNKLYACLTFCVFAAYMIYIPFHFSSDGWVVFRSYSMIDGMESGRVSGVWSMAVSSGFASGRYTRGLFTLLAAFLGKLQWTMSPLAGAIGIGLLAIAGCMAWSTITEHRKENAILPFACLIIFFCQPFLTDWFQFSECTLMYSLGVLSAVVSAKAAFSKKTTSLVKKWILGCVWLLIAAGFYQIAMQWFVLMSMAIVIIDITDSTERKTKPRIKRLMIQIFYALSIYVVAFVFQLLFTEVFFESPRTDVYPYTLQYRISDFLQEQKELWGMVSYTGNKVSLLFPVVCVLSGLSSVISMIEAQTSRSEKVTVITTICVCTLGCYASIFLPSFLTNSYYPQRCIVGFWGIPLLLSLAAKSEIKPNGELSIVRIIPVIASVAMILINIYSCLCFGSDLYRVNAMDTMRAQLIDEQIQAYEAETGNQVRNLAFHYDNSRMYYYAGVKSCRDNNLCGWAAPWNPMAIMNVSTGKNYSQSGYSDELYHERYGDKNWDMYSPEQVFILDDTAYIVIY